MSVCREVGSYICGKTGITLFDYAFVEIGQSFISKAVPVILAMAEKRPKTIVVGLFLSMAVADMAESSSVSIGMMNMETRRMLDGKDVHFAERSLLPDERISRWIVARALEWTESLP